MEAIERSQAVRDAEARDWAQAIAEPPSKPVEDAQTTSERIAWIEINAQAAKDDDPDDAGF